MPTPAPPGHTTCLWLLADSRDNGRGPYGWFFLLHVLWPGGSKPCLSSLAIQRSLGVALRAAWTGQQPRSDHFLFVGLAENDQTDT